MEGACHTVMLVSFPDAPFPEEPAGGRQFDDFGSELVRFKSLMAGACCSCEITCMILYWTPLDDSFLSP
jgi:hypothetical protein